MDLSRTLDKVFLALPNYCLGQCISDFYQNYEFIQFCTSSVEAIFICKAFSESLPWSWLAPFGVLYGAGGAGKAGVGPAGLWAALVLFWRKSSWSWRGELCSACALWQLEVMEWGLWWGQG